MQQECGKYHIISQISICIVSKTLHDLWQTPVRHIEKTNTKLIRETSRYFNFQTEYNLPLGRYPQDSHFKK